MFVLYASPGYKRIDYNLSIFTMRLEFIISNLKTKVAISFCYFMFKKHYRNRYL